MADIARPDYADIRQRDGLEFRLLRGALFLVFMPIALFGRLLPRAMRPLHSDARSPIAEAREAANTLAPFAFMR